ncbi:hypothetical protein ACFQ15_06360 [Sphingomonas hankookensis]|uniref:hypothetical protein n=1 Tax=Sphingomonas hankookensis TaxID=563996 RepID=UPI001F578346|nr:hypothetical protein [Sphingomonas hankookensis]
MPWTLLLPTVLAAATCPIASQNIPVIVTTLSPAAIGAVPDPENNAVLRVGPFVYQGYGNTVRSNDPRFGDLLLGSGGGLRHRCGNQVFPPSPWNRPRTGSMPGMIAVLRAATPAPDTGQFGDTEAERHGVRPILAGHVAGPSWPVYHDGGTFFLGLMYPMNNADQTRLVAFRDEAGAVPALSLAVLPMRLQAMNVTPGLHEPDDYLNLAALRPEELVQITLRSSPGAMASIAAALSGEKERGWSG